MKRLFILLSAIPFIAHAQENKKADTQKKIYLGFSFSPDYNYRALKNNDSSSWNDYVINSRNGIEKGKFGFTTGINLNVTLSQKLEIQTGLTYTNKGYKVPKQPTNYPIPERGQPTHFKSKAKYNYIDVPLKLNFISGKGKIRFLAGAGLALDFLVHNSEVVTLYYEVGDNKEYDQSDGFDYKKFNLSALISAGAEYQLKKNIFLRTELTFRYGVLKIIDMPVTAKLWNIGLNMGVYFNLR